ncbi:hypothetical protein IT400_04370 [Candidatus Nomurabacteria bacterium]|nr:hypothetical protein [Candidatus Nomurabacteria bacterium]
METPNKNDYGVLKVPSCISDAIGYLKRHVNSYFMEQDYILSFIKNYEKWLLECPPTIFVKDFQNIYLVKKDENSGKLITEILNQESTNSYQDLQLITSRMNRISPHQIPENFIDISTSGC